MIRLDDHLTTAEGQKLHSNLLKLLLTARSPFNDGYTQEDAEKDLFLLKHIIDKYYNSIPKRKQWEDELILTTLKK